MCCRPIPANPAGRATDLASRARRHAKTSHTVMARLDIQRLQIGLPEHDHWQHLADRFPAPEHVSTLPRMVLGGRSTPWRNLQIARGRGGGRPAETRRRAYLRVYGQTLPRARRPQRVSRRSAPLGPALDGSPRALAVSYLGSFHPPRHPSLENLAPTVKKIRRAGTNLKEGRRSDATGGGGLRPLPDSRNRDRWEPTQCRGRKTTEN